MILPRCAMRAKCRKEMDTCMWGGDTGAWKWARARRTLRHASDHISCTPHSCSTSPLMSGQMLEVCPYKVNFGDGCGCQRYPGVFWFDTGLTLSMNH